jgi:transposase
MHYYGIDVHKKFCAFTCMDDAGRVLRRGKVANTAEMLAQMVAPSGGDALAVLETTGNWSYIYDTLEPWVAKVLLAHALRVKAIASAKVKTDRIDADTLAHLLRADLIPQAYVPSPEVRELRDWLRSRAAVVRMSTQLKNRVHALLARNGLTSPYADLFCQGGWEWLQQVELRPMHRRIIDRYLAILDALQADTRVVTAEVTRQAKADPRAKLLMSIPGIGPLTALLFLAEVGDLRRFSTAAQLVSFAGLAPRVRSSAGRVHMGPITKQGSAWLRWTFNEAAVRIGRTDGRLGQFYRSVQARHGKQTAATALARKLLTIAYFVLKAERPFDERMG